jgi:hypothetical protein
MFRSPHEVKCITTRATIASKERTVVILRGVYPERSERAEDDSPTF